MTKNTAFDKLSEYPKKLGLEFDTHQSRQRLYLFPDDPIENTKFVIFKVSDLFFQAFDSVAAKAYVSKTFTGLYGLINLPIETNLKVYKRDWTDKFLRSHKRKLGDSNIDKNLTITSRSKSIPNGLITEKTCEIFLNLYAIISPVKIIIDFDYVNRIADLRNKVVVGVETNQWLYDNSNVDQFISLGGDIISNFISNASA